MSDFKICTYKIIKLKTVINSRSYYIFSITWMLQETRPSLLRKGVYIHSALWSKWFGLTAKLTKWTREVSKILYHLLEVLGQIWLHPIRGLGGCKQLLLDKFFHQMTPSWCFGQWEGNFLHFLVSMTSIYLIFQKFFSLKP